MRLAGSRSALARTRFNYQDAAFGRSVLKKMQQRPAAMPANTSFTLFEGPLRIAPQAEAINVRSRCPKNYGSVVSQLTTSSQSESERSRLSAISETSFIGLGLRKSCQTVAGSLLNGANRKLQRVKSEIARPTSIRGLGQICGRHAPGTRISPLWPYNW
jgi:hypothetical protein